MYRGYLHIVLMVTIGVIALALVVAVGYYKVRVLSDANTAVADTNRTVNVNTPLATNSAQANTNTTANVPADWTTYRNDDLGISFQYPSAFGTVEITHPTAPVPSQETGTRILGTFSENPDLSFGGMSPDYSYPSEGTIFHTQGFTQTDGKYYFHFTSDKEPTFAPLEPLKVLTANTKVLLIEDYSFINDRGSDGPTLANSLGQYHLAGLVNLTSRDYKGLVFVNANLEAFPLSDFEKMLQTITTGMGAGAGIVQSPGVYRVGDFTFRYPVEWGVQDGDGRTGSDAIFVSSDGTRAATLTCPIPEIGFEGYTFEETSRSLSSSRRIGATLQIGTPAIEEVTSPIALLSLYRGTPDDPFGETPEDYVATCLLVSSQTSGNIIDIFHDIYESVETR